MFLINTDSVKKYSKKLDSLNRSALPVAIRESLNDCAKDMKMNTLMKESKDSFINREHNFFKANSSYDRATGFSVNQMKAVIGMVDDRLKGSNNYSVKDLEQQESGGRIKKKAFIPMKSARKSGSNSLVRPNARLQKIKTIVDVSKQDGTNKGVQFELAVFKAGKGGFVLANKTLFKVNSVFREKGDTRFKLTPLYSFKAKRSVKVSAHNFVKRAGNDSREKIEQFFQIRAEKEILKYMK